MVPSKSHELLWKRSAIVAAMLVALVVPRQAAAQTNAQKPLNQYEKSAVQVVSDWITAWQNHDPDKMASYVTDDFKFRMDPSEGTFRTGKARFLCQMRGMAGGGNGGGIVIKNASYEAIGDSVFVLVIMRRTDTFAGGGRRGGGPGGAAPAPGGAPPDGGQGRAAAPPPGLTGDIPAGAFFVVKNGKIAEWMDTTLAFDITTLPARGPGAGPGQNCQ